MRRRKRLRFFNLEKIEQGREPLSPTELEVRECLAQDAQEQLLAKLDLEAALNALTPKQKTCFLLFAEGHTVREISATLSLAPTTVQQHLTAARKTLKKILGDTVQNP